MKVYQKNMEENSIVSILSHFFLLFIAFGTPLTERNHLVNKWLYLSVLILILIFRLFLIYSKERKFSDLFAEISIYLTGTWWSVLLFYELYYNTEFDNISTVLLFIVIGLTAGGALSMFKRKRLVFIYIIILLIPTTFSIYRFGKDLSNLLGSALILFFSFNLVYAIKQNTIWQNLQKNKKEIIKKSEELKIKNQELNKALKTAEDAAKTKAQFLANMSHEIRTPMNGVIATADILNDMDLKTEQKELVNIIQKSGNLLLKIINDILDFSKIEVGKMNIQNISFNLIDSVGSIIDVFKISSKEKKIEMLTFIDSRIKMNIFGDDIRINQILINLIGNAIKFTNEGEVVLKIDLIEDAENYYTIKFAIEDSGIGISIEKQKIIFEAFTQENGSTTRLYGGTGLGTTISKMLVDLMGGKIGLESPNPNNKINKNGSIFFFILKLKKDKTFIKQENLDSTYNLANIKKIKILIAEDNIVNQKILLSVLKQIKLNAEIANNGQEVLDKLANEKFDLVFMDIQMPILDGIKTVEIMRKKNDNTLVIAMTANAMNEDKDMCINAGMNDYISKPFKKDDLYKLLYKYFGG